MLRLIFVVGAIALLSNNAVAGVQLLTSPPELLVAGGDNYIALPAIPIDASPTVILGSGFSFLGRYDSPTGLLVEFGSPGFGGMLMSDGYKLSSAANISLSFSAYVDEEGYDTFVSLPKTGWNLIGSPYTYPVDWASVLVTDGTKTISLTQASKVESPAWLDSVAIYVESTTSLQSYVGLDSDFKTSSSLKPWLGYWVRSRKDNIAILIPGTPGIGGSSDMVAPNVGINSILQQTAAGSPTITGTASDNVSVASVKWATDTGASGTATGTTSWSAAIPIVVGDNVIAITAKDTSGNFTTKKTRVYCGLTMVGNIVFEDYNGPMPVSIMLSYQNNGVQFTQSVATIDGSGNFRAWAPQGSYTVAAKARYFLQQNVNVTVGSSNISGVNFSLMNGDCDGDNEITSTDLSILGLSLGAALGVAEFDATGDLDGDGEVTSTDLSILGLSLGQTGN